MASYRALLRKMVAGLAVVFAAAMFYVFAASLYPTLPNKSEKLITVDLSRLKPGEAMVRKWDELPVVILHRTEKQVSEVALWKSQREHVALDPLVPDPEGLLPGLRSFRSDYFVAFSVPGRGVPCSAQYQGTESEYPGLVRYPVAFIEQCRGTFFDAGGHLMQGSWEGPDLSIPPHRYLSEKMIEIGPPVSDPAQSFKVQFKGLQRRSL